MIELSEQQQQVFDKYIQKQNIFITGPGGSGKSALIKYIYDDACKRGKKIYVTALTGCAAVLLNCNAKTVHSWAGIGLGNGDPEIIIEKIINNRYKKKVWRETDILIVDEISMMSLKLFDLLNLVGQHVRGFGSSNRPFGGIQVIFSGDFYQLPPVSSAQGLATDPKDGQFCFESALWNTVFKPENQIPLIKIFRQKDDEYVSILNQIREGKIKRKSFAKLSEYVGRQVASDALIQPTKIFPTRAKVDHVNMMEMAKLDGYEHEFKLKFMTDIPGVKKEFKYLQEDMDIEMKYLERSLLCESTMKLKVGSQVMCIVNMELPDGQMLCNGSQGIVTGFVGGLGTNPSPKIKFNGIPNEVTLSPHTWASEKYPGIGVCQLPLILAWAITIHKSQGASLDMAEIDVGSDIFECGQTYVALSRVRSLDGLYLTSLDISKILINKKVQDFYAAINTI